MKKYEVEIWYSEYELRQFIDMACRFEIGGVYKGRTVENPYSDFDFYVKNARSNFESFCIQLRTKLGENQNWKAIEIDVKDKFLPMIDKFLKWYEDNKKEIEIFNPYNPYEIMFSVIESTKREILKYFPVISKNGRKGKPAQTFESLFKDLSKAKQVKDILENLGYTLHEQWQGNNGKDTELLAVYHALKPILKQGKITPQATIFYNEFGLTVGKDNTNNNEYITDRSLRNHPLNDDIEIFEGIFASLLPKK